MQNKSPEECDLTQATIQVREKLALYRLPLSQFLVHNGIDKVTIPQHDRVIVSTRIVSSKRITQGLMLQTVRSLVESNKGARIPDLMWTTLKRRLLEVVDTITLNADVVASTSKQAKMKPRDGPALIEGSPQLLTDDILEIAQAIWSLKQTSANVAQRRKAMKIPLKPTPNTCIDSVEPSCEEILESLTPSPQVQLRQLSPRDSPPQVPKEKGTITNSVVEAAITEQVMSDSLQGRPKSSISKSQAYLLIQAVSDLILSLSQDKRMPIWEAIEISVTELIGQFYLNPKK